MTAPTLPAATSHPSRLPAYLACFRVHPAQKTSSQLAEVGQEELDALRHRTFGRALTPAEIVAHPRLQAYLRASARLDLFAKIQHRKFPGGQLLRTPALVLAMLWYRMRDWI